MTVSAICELPVREIVNANAHLYLWTTNAFLPEALEVHASVGIQVHDQCRVGQTPNGSGELFPQRS